MFSEPVSTTAFEFKKILYDSLSPSLIINKDTNSKI